MKKNQRALKRNLYYLIIVFGWGLLSLVASQFITAILMYAGLGEKFSEPFWVMIYYALNYDVSANTFCFAASSKFVPAAYY